MKQALDLLDQLAPYHLAWAEEFLPPFDPAPHAELRTRGKVHISGGEGITKSAAFAQWLRADAFDIAQPDPTIVAGIGEARRVCELAAAVNLAGVIFEPLLARTLGEKPFDPDVVVWRTEANRRFIVAALNEYLPPSAKRRRFPRTHGLGLERPRCGERP